MTHETSHYVQFILMSTLCHPAAGNHTPTHGAAQTAFVQLLYGQLDMHTDTDC